MRIKLKKVFVSGTSIDLNKERIELERNEPQICSGTAVFSMLEDAKQEKEDVYKIETPVKPKNKIPRFVLL